MTEHAGGRAESLSHSGVAFSDEEIVLLSACVTAVGGTEFISSMCRLCARLAQADSVFLSAFFRGETPLGLYSSHTTVCAENALRTYTDVAYVLDPFYLYFLTSPGDEVVTLSDIAPDEFRQSQYHELVYEAIGLHDECGLFVNVSDDAALFFSLGVHQPGRVPRADRLRAAMPVICALARRHWSAFSRADPEGRGRVAAHLGRAFDAFGTSRLSPRESEIARMILRGHSNKSIARELGNSPETVKVHRRRIYTKLSIETQGHLLSLFLDALSVTQVGHEGDPLLNLSRPDAAAES